MTMPILEVDRLVKRFGDMTAVDEVSFEVQPGELFGLLGPNGAGKTTTLASIAGLLRPDGGRILVGGHPVDRERQEAQRVLGVVPQEVALYEDLSAEENLRFFGRLKGLGGAELARRSRELLELVGLLDHARQRVSRFSGGMKRRLNMAVGLIGEPKLLLLDEPTVGVDPQSRRHILDLVAELARRGTAVLFTSHYMEEVEYLCRRIAIMDHGRIIAQGPLEQVRALAGEAPVIRVRLEAALPEATAAQLRSRFDGQLSLDERELRILLTHGSARVGETISWLEELGLPMEGLRLEPPDLETVFLALTGRELRDGGGEP
ncbi:MAG: ABC transporter ATP-binding protein [Clostridia bacterium]|nr:ABC transporter ATP-binding protein [Clostridia bacterium]